jgi:two-component system, CAI-1 autoinducer sensor kinase/phosphatase CqsS
MYSLLPALVAALFFGYGVYVLAQKGLNRVSAPFFALCVGTFLWQATWAVLFQVRDATIANYLVRFGYLAIVFLPTFMYHFLVEVSQRRGEQHLVWVSYGVSILFGAFALGSNLLVSGYHEYFWGYYPKAEVLHPLNVLHALLAGGRSLYITWQQERAAPPAQPKQLRLCIASVIAYLLAGTDYLCNYGLEFYPPGVVFVAISLGFIAIAAVKYDLMNAVAMAATVAHEMRTPLASIRMQAQSLAQYLPELRNGYQLAVAHGLVQPTLPSSIWQRLENVPRSIQHQVDRSNTVIDMLLAAARVEHIDTSAFARCSVMACVEEALDTYPFAPGERERVNARVETDFEIHGSNGLLIYVLFNLLKNSLYAIKAAGKGNITIGITAGTDVNKLTFNDTGSGIPATSLPRIFETFYTTKKASGAGIGLAFCRRAVAAFGGEMRCTSLEGQHTTFTLTFKPNLKAAG